MATIGGNVTITGIGSTFLDDYNVNGNVTIHNSGGAPAVVGVENLKTSVGIPVIDGNVTITGATATGMNPGLIIDIGTGGADGTNTTLNNPLFIEGNLGITASGTGSVAVDLNDLSVANGTTSVNLGAQTSGDTVQVQGSASVTSVFDAFNITSSAAGTTVGIQDAAGTIEFGGAVNVQLGGKSATNTLDLAADSGNAAGVVGAVVDLFSPAVFNGGAGTTSTLFGESNETLNTDLFFATAPRSLCTSSSLDPYGTES